LRTRLTTLALVLVTGLALSSCGSDEPTTTEESPAASSSAPTPTEATEAPASEEPEPEPEPEGTVVVVTFKGDRIEPNGATVEAQVGKPVTLAITSDRAGELHVHSSPEQFVEFAKGSSEHELTFERPGVVEVEDHATGFVLMNVQVR
jgi:hypothetical protein